MKSRTCIILSLLVILSFVWARTSTAQMSLAPSPDHLSSSVAVVPDNPNTVVDQSDWTSRGNTRHTEQTASIIVLDVTTKEPIPDARVDARFLESNPGVTDGSVCITGSDGRCNIGIPHEGRAAIAVGAGGYLFQELVVTLSSDEPLEILTFALEKEKDSTEAIERASPNSLSTLPEQYDGDWIPILSSSRANAELKGVTAITNERQGKIRVLFTLPGLIKLTDNAEIGEGSVLRIPDGFLSLQDGMPVIPAVTGKLAMPPGATIVDVKVIRDDVVELDYIEPQLHIPVKVTPSGPVTGAIEPTELAEIYPSEVFRVRELGSLRDGNTLGSVALWPVQYDPLTRIILVHAEMELEIAFDYDAAQATSLGIDRILEGMPRELSAIKELQRGERTVTRSGSGCPFASGRSFLVREDGRSEYTMISAGFWRTEASEASRHFIGVMTYSEAEATGFQRAKTLQHLSDYGVVESVTQYAYVLDFIKSEWSSSPGLVIFGSPGGEGGLLAPLASYLNWPLIGLFDNNEASILQELVDTLNVTTVIVGGEIPPAISGWLSDTGIRTIYLANEREINQFFHSQKLQSGFYETEEDPDDKVYEREIINSDFRAEYPRLQPMGAAPQASINYLVVTDSDYYTAAVELATYRSASIINVDGDSADTVRSTINSYDPLYIAILGDGDVGDASCFYVADPIDEPLDPDTVGTDFYYEVRESLSVGQLTDGWTIDSYVGRVIGSSDQETQEYIDTLKRYENGCLPDWGFLDWAILGSNNWGPGYPYYDETMIDVANYLADSDVYGGYLMEPDSPNYDQADGPFTENEYVQGTYGLNAGVTVGYVHTHGDANYIGFGDPINSRFYDTEADNYESVWRDAPFLQYSAACLTARFMGTGYSPAANVGVAFIDSEAIGYVGSTMIANQGAIVGIDHAFFEDRITDWDYTLGQALAWSRESWYAAQIHVPPLEDYFKKTVWEMMLIGDPKIDLLLSSSEQPPGCPPPNAPSNLNAIAISDGQVNLIWEDNSDDETSFRIERSPDGSTGWTEIGSVGTDIESYQDTTVSCETTYYYRVRAYRSGDDTYSTPSNVDSATTHDCPVNTYRVYGYVYEGGSGLEGVWVSDGYRGDYTNSSGYYEIAGVPDGWYGVTPSKVGYTFNPASRTVHVDSADKSVDPFYGSPTSGGEGIYYPVADTSISMQHQYTRYGDEPRLWVGRNWVDPGPPYYQADYGLLRFDLSDIAGETVCDAQLEIFFDYDDGATIEVAAHEMLDSWPESIRYSEWDHDYSSAHVDEDVSGSGWVIWDNLWSRPWIQDWLDNPSINYGFFLQSTDSDYVKHGWVSKEGNSDYWPRLVVRVCDEPAELVVSQPEPVGGVSPPFEVGQIVQWRVVSTNHGPGCAQRHDVGYYLGTSPNDYSNRLDDDRIGPVLAGDSEDDDDFMYTFQQAGTYYLNVWVDDDNGDGGNGEVWETDENNNKNSFGPFQVVQPNQPPTISGLPDRALDEDGYLDNTIDLWAYASDETPDEGLVFSINNSPDPSAGVYIDAGRYVDIDPATNWCGATDVEIRVADPEGLSDTDTFHVTVNCINDDPWISPPVPDRTEDVDVPITIDLSEYEHDTEDSGAALDWHVTDQDNCTVSGEYSDDDVLTFTPDAGFDGSDTVTLHLVDSGGGEATQGVTLTWTTPNTLPTLSWTGEPNYTSDGLDPETGYSSTTFVYRAEYADSDGDTPNYVRVHVLKGGAEISGSPFNMSYVSGDHTAGAIYSYSLSGLAVGVDYAYHFEAQDSRGANADPTVEVSAPIIYGIIHTPVTTAIENTPVPITATVTSETSSITVTLHYRITGAPGYTGALMSNTSGGVYSATIPASAVTLAGVDYYISASDGEFTSTHPSTGSHYINVHPAIVVNEVDPYGPEAIELYNASSQAADMAGWQLFGEGEDENLHIVYTFPAFTLQPDAYVVVHGESGTDTDTDLYTGWSPMWNYYGGAVALADDGGSGVDFVRWGFSSVAPLTGTGWSGTNPSGPSSGRTLGRDAASTDTDDGSDWCSQTPTLGAQNVGCRTCWAQINDDPTDYTTVQAAVDTASDGDVVKVAGYCTGVQTRVGVTQTVYVSKTLTVQGGYTTTNWITPDPDANPTTLDAQAQGRVLYITGDICPTIEGLRITGGDATGLGGGEYGYDVGGGVYIITASGTVSDNWVFSNTAYYGGGLYLISSDATLSGNTVTNNNAAWQGGGLCLVNSPATLSDNAVTANSSGYWGGGLYLQSSAATLDGNLVAANTTQDMGGGLYLQDSPAMLSANAVTSNTAYYAGGGLAVWHSTATLVGNLIAANTTTADGGGGLRVSSSPATLRANTIISNTAADYGGGVYLEASPATLDGNIIISNVAHYAGGGVYMWASDATLTNNVIAHNWADSLGSGLVIWNSSPRILHTTIAQNLGGDGTGLHITNLGLDYSTVALTNTILVSHTVGITVAGGNTATLEATLWGAGAWANIADWGGTGTIITSTINIWGDPAFVDPHNRDYHINTSSAALDAGVDAGVSDDIDGNLRPYGTGYDIGADEATLCDTVSEIPKAECNALEALYNSTDGPNWSDDSGWLNTSTPCSWYGVTCNGGHVTQLVLDDNQLVGNIPTQLDDLVSLQWLWLSNNQLNDSIPVELGNLAALQRLYLGSNQLSGSIPAELGTLENLRLLHLYNNQLTGVIPPELGSITNLEYLALHNNQLTGTIPSELGQLVNLEELLLHENQLSGDVPPELGDLSSLGFLMLSDNQLSGSIPAELGSLANLQWLYLQNNQLVGAIPLELGSLTGLVRLRIQNNALVGEIPSTIADLINLSADPWHTDFSYNKLTASDPAVIAFLNDKDPDWADTQTVPPTDVQVVDVSDSSVELSWTPITYTAHGGFYEVSLATTPGGPYTVHGTTSDKTATGYVADGLSAHTTYFFVVRTHTPAHGDQQNDLWSDYSHEVSATTSLSPPITCTVTSTVDSGPGTLRGCLEQVVSGDRVDFDTAVFPPTTPSTIALASGLPDLDDGNVTIDASNAGVILDGSGIGTTPETMLLDDVSLMVDGGPNLIANGDFSAGLGHWRPWDDASGATRSITTTDFHSSPNAYAWSTVASVGNSHTVYDTSDTSDPFDNWPYDETSTVWMTATSSSTVEIHFWYRYGGVDVGLRDLSSDGQSHNRWGWWFDWQADWTEAVITHTVSDDAVGVALELDYHHSESWTRGLLINSSGNTVRGLQIVNCPFDGILIIDASDNVIGGDRAVGSGPLGQGNLISANGSQGIQICGDSANNQVLGNYIGTDVAGSAPMPNAADGVTLQCWWAGPHDNIIGGTTTGTRNLISGNGGTGVRLQESAHDNVVIGNYIGTDATGTSALGNGGGVWITEVAYSNTIGGSTTVERNLISGNNGHGVCIEGSDTTSNTISGNYIGTDSSGTVALPNGWSGVALHDGVQFNTIGPDNIVAYNGGYGIHVLNPDTLYNTITQNSIHDSNETGIELGDGGNAELAAPVITDFDLASGVVTGTACANCTVEVFSDSADEGEVYEGQTTADGSGDFTFNKGSSLTGPNVMATATDLDGNTSEFSARPPTTCTVTSTGDSGPDTLRECLENAVNGDLIAFDQAVFPPTSPVTIALASGLPDLDDGNVTIDASDTGVVLDGSGIGTTPETMLLDDVSLTLNGGPNLIANGDFSPGLGHWRPWDDASGVARSITTTDFHSSLNAYAWSTVASVGNSHTVYDTSDTSDPFDNWPYDETSTVWMTATSSSTVEIHFWYRYGGVGIGLRDLSSDGQNHNRWGWWFDWQADWTEAVISHTLPSDAIGVALEFEHSHSQSWTRGLSISSSGNTIRGLQIVNFPGDGICVDNSAQHNMIGGDRNIGPGPMGQGNLISGNGGSAVAISGVGTMSNTVSGNYIGTDREGLTAIGNGGLNAVHIWDGAAYNEIGGMTDGERNIVSGNDFGVVVNGAHHNRIVGNYLGVDATGSGPLGNQSAGAGIGDGGQYNVIERNIVGANNWVGVYLHGADTKHNRIIGNYIGTDETGMVAIGNGAGVEIAQGAQENTVGDDTSAERNLISGNDGEGVRIEGSGTTSNTVVGNCIGTNVSATAAISNTGNGISIRDGASNNVIGGNTPGERNLISGNNGDGVWIWGSGADHNVVSGNFIGTDVNGTAKLPNHQSGVAVLWGAQYNRIGGSQPGEGNVISGNDNVGISLDGTNVMSNTVLGNWIGTDVTGMAALGNGNDGVWVIRGAQHNVIGGPDPSERNLISGNGGGGVRMWDASTMSNTIIGNYIGTDVSETAPLGNQNDGIVIESGRENVVGPDNTIAHNEGHGVRVSGPDAVRNTITQNSIRDNDGMGIELDDGGNTELAAPVISGFDLASGIVTGTACANCTVEVFSDSSDEGEVYEGQTTADGSGDFVFNKGASLTGPNVMATATDANGNTSEFSARAPIVCTVTSTADSGIGSLRACLENAASGDLIDFDTVVFPPGVPATITVFSGLPDLDDGSVTIDASDAGVILDGSGIGTIPETMLLDDVSLTLNGGPNLISNDDFTAGLGHWRPWDDHPGATRGISTTDFHSSPSAYEWTTVVQVGNSNTVYDTADTSDPLDDWPFYDGSTVWIPATGGSTVEIRFWYRYGGVDVGLRDLSSDGENHNRWGWWFDWSSDWTEAVINQTVSSDAVGVALELNYRHSESWTRNLTINSNGNTIRGLQIVNSPYDGILIINANDNVIGGDRNLGSGLLGQGNLISANGGHGIQICGESANNRVLGNYIGTDLVGGSAMPNTYSGVALQCSPGPHDNIVGGTSSGTRNLISGNAQNGVSLSEASHDNAVVGNYIGTDITGTAAIENESNGIWINDATNNLIGGPSDAERNIITYNGWNGIAVRGNGSVSNTIQNNWIGIDADSTGGLDSRDLVVADDGTLFLADFGRGVFTSSDSASSWQAANSGLTTLEIEIVAVSPDFASTQRAWAWGDGQLFVSNDAGANWSLLSSALSSTLKALEISPDYAVDQTLLAAVDGHGIYKSTDGGGNWVQTHDTSNADNIAFSPHFATDQVALVGLSWYGVLRSTDGGDTWVESNTGLPNAGVYDLAFAPDGQTVLLVSHRCDNDGVYRSADGGQTWSGSGNGLDDCGSEWQVAVSPNFASDGIAFAAEDSMYRSTDGGTTWGGSHNGVFGSRGHALAFSHNFAGDQTVYLANFAGVFRTTDGGDHWTWAGANLGDRGNGGRGVEICCGAGATQVLSNVIGRNGSEGISIWDPDAAGSLVDGNLVGLAPDGVTRAGNGGTNIRIDTAYVTVTNNTCAAGGHGGLRSGTAAHHLNITDNRFGTNISGTVAIGNSYDGISLESSWDTVRNNLVSGNWGNGILSSEHYTGSAFSVFAGNLVGVDASGSQALPNEGTGLTLSGSYHTVGGDSPADRNIISGNSGYGIRIRSGAHHNTVSGNYIGTDITGMAAIGNRWYGVVIYDGASDNIIGGDTPGERNLISGNGGDGVTIWDSNENMVSGNYIGTNASGTAAMSNAGSGVSIGGGASYNLIGGDTAGERNLISGNGEDGVSISDSDTMSNTVSGNYIGTNVNGTAEIANQHFGVSLSGEASHNTIGGGDSGQGNLVSGNVEYGIGLWDSAHDNTVIGNLIGTDASGTAALGNGYQGVSPWDGAYRNRIGGSTPGERNIISGNGGNGVFIESSGTTSNTVIGNYIGTDIGGTTAVPNVGNGIQIVAGASSNYIGGGTPGEGNVIAYNGEHGVAVYNSGSLYNTITRNSIHDNTRLGIELGDGGNAELAAPVITGYDLATGVLTGTTCANCLVEVFSDSTYQGQVYEGQTIADGAGDFALYKGAPFSGPHLTATATDDDGNTSEFSDPVPPVNTPPILAGLPNQIFDHSTSPTSTIDLWAYAWDAQTPADALTYTLEITPPTGAGVTLVGNRYVTVNPSTDWCGYIDIPVQATDPGGLWDSDTFRVAVTWSCRGPLPVANQAAPQDEPISIDLTAYEPQIGDGSAPLPWYVTGEDYCTVSGEYSEDDVLTFTPEAGFVGSDTVRLHMVYPWGSEVTQEITLMWKSSSAPPPEFKVYLPVVARGYP